MNPKRVFFRTSVTVCALLTCVATHAQVDSGSNGSDGAFNPTTNTVINMADHPNGIYQYTSINIPGGVTVTFIPNANNTPVVWLVQSNVVINGSVDVSGQNAPHPQGGLGGPGGYRGGTSGLSGLGPGGGQADANASYGGSGRSVIATAGPTYGNLFLIPLIGGSGGGGSTYQGNNGGGGGGGAILIACSGTIHLNGKILALCGPFGVAFNSPTQFIGSGSSGAVRLVASKIAGVGQIRADGEAGGGAGRVRFDCYENDFGGSALGVFSQGSQFVIIPSAGQLPQLTVTSIAGVPVSASPTGALSTPDAVLSAQQNNPVPIVVHCSNIPLNTQITVSVKPANGPAVSATGLNNVGTLASSTATVSINMPRGGGLIYATAATGN